MRLLLVLLCACRSDGFEDFAVEANPYNPFSAIASAQVDGDSRVEVDGVEVPAIELGRGQFLIEGLRADTRYEIRLVSDQGATLPVPHRTEPLTDGFPEVEVTGDRGDDWICTNGAHAEGAVYFCFDDDGTPLWSIEHPDGTVFLVLEPLSDGRYAAVTESSEPRLAVFDPRGALVDEIGAAWIDARSRFRHTWVDVHDVIELRDGPWKGAVAVLTGVSDATSVGDRLGYGLAVIDLAQREVLWDWSSHGELGDDQPIDPLLAYDRVHPEQDPVDWQHANALVHGLDPDGGQFFWMSLRHQDWIVKIDVETDEIAWRFGYEGDFGGLAPDQWMVHQHAPQIAEREGDRIRLSVFDNGNFRRLPDGNPDPATPFSRAVVFELDEATMQATEIFSVGWPDSEFYSAIRGDADLEGDRLRYLSSWPGRPAIVEVSVPDGAELWRAVLPDGSASYRAVRR